MLNYDDFKRKYYDTLMTELKPKKIFIEPHSILKVNQEKEGIIVHYPDSPISPMIYYDDDFQEHRIMARPVEELARKKARDIVAMKENLPDVPEIRRDHSRLYCTVLNRDRNKELLKRTPHINIADLAIAARFRVSSNASFLVDNDACASLQMTGEEVLEAARENTRERGYVCKPLSEVMRGIFSDGGVSDDYIEEALVIHDEPDIYVLTNREGMDGAVVGTDSKILGEIREAMGKDFFILPSSRHELLLVPKDIGMSIDDMERMVCEVNDRVVDEKDILSDHVYTLGPAMELTLASQEQELSFEKEPEMERFYSRGR